MNTKALLVGGFNHLEKILVSWEGLSHISHKLWKINMFETTNQIILTNEHKTIILTVGWLIGIPTNGISKTKRQ